MSRTGTLTQESTNAAAAALSSVASFRRASARFRGPAVPDSLSPPDTPGLPPSHILPRGTWFRIVSIGTRFHFLQDDRSGSLHQAAHPRLAWPPRRTHAANISAQFRNHDCAHADRLPACPAGLARGGRDPGNRARVAV